MDNDAVTNLSVHDENEDVYRYDIKERRASYYVTYQPADSRYPFALLNLVYPEAPPDRERIKGHMTKEITEWLTRFPVPVMASAFDASGDCLEVLDDSSDSSLMGYMDSKTSKVVCRWGTLGDGELPIEQSKPQYLSMAYEGIPYRFKSLFRKQADEKAIQLRNGMRLFRIASIFWVGIPLSVEIISLGVNWIGYALWSLSVSIGLFKFARVLGWIKPSKRQLAKDEEAQQMRHYYYHCERNPNAFERLRNENFEREAIEDTRQEFKSLLPAKRAAS
jgi:hypothetical protein